MKPVLRVVQATAAVGALAAVVMFGRHAAAQLPVFAGWVGGLGAWGPMAFVAGYSVAAVFFLPCVLLTITAGALWGLGAGIVYAMLGATGGAALAFVAARTLVRGLVQSYVQKHPRLAAVDRAVETEGVRLMLLLRLSPAVPYVVLNYVLGISRVRFRDYLIGMAGMIPVAAAYVYAGKVVGDVAMVASGTNTPRGGAYWALLAGGLIATVVASVLLARAANRAVQQQL